MSDVICFSDSHTIQLCIDEFGACRVNDHNVWVTNRLPGFLSLWMENGQKTLHYHRIHIINIW